MRKDFQNMLYLFGANANGAEIQLREELNIEEIRKFSLEQGIWTMVYPELSKIHNVQQYHMEFLAMVSKGMMQNDFTLSIINKMENLGIHCCLLKGVSVSRLYANPDYRISSDTDILIDPKDELRVIEILMEHGYTVKKREKNDHHLKAYHKNGGLLEVHVQLYSEITARILFNGIEMYTEQWEKIQIGKREFFTLEINDGLMYLTAHYIKHLINSGGGIRQMMDLLLYMDRYKNQIDFNRYEKCLKELRYDRLVEVIRSVGAQYFGFNYEIKNKQLVDKILEDTEAGGIFGFSTDNRKNFYERYCQRRAEISTLQYVALNIQKAEQSILYKLFPDKKVLVNCGYRYAKNSIFLPVAWVHRLIKLAIRARKKNNLSENKSRMQLMCDLGMIE